MCEPGSSVTKRSRDSTSVQGLQKDGAKDRSELFIEAQPAFEAAPVLVAAMDKRTVGCLGGGQLGRMMVYAAHRLGVKMCVLDPLGERSPAGQVPELQCLLGCPSKLPDPSAPRLTSGCRDVGEGQLPGRRRGPGVGEEVRHPHLGGGARQRRRA